MIPGAATTKAKIGASERATFFGVHVTDSVPAGLVTLRECTGSDAHYGEGTMGEYRSRGGAGVGIKYVLAECMRKHRTWGRG